MTKTINNSTLYEQDFYLWLIATAKLLRERAFTAIDIDNLVEEIEAMGRSEKNALKSNLRILLMHLLKYHYQPLRRSNSWKSTIIEHRLRLRDAFFDSPSLKRYFAEVLAQCYEDARRLASAETELPLDTFPQSCIFTEEEILNLDYLPD